MAKIRPISHIADKWSNVTPQRATDYQDGVKNPKKDWAEEALKAEEAYKEAVTRAAAEGRYGKGVAAAGYDKWKNRTLSKGPSRFSEGVMLARTDYEKGFAPYRDAIESTELPPRGPKGDPRNIERVSIIAKTLHAVKVGK